MAARARHIRMGSGQRECFEPTVIEVRRWTESVHSVAQLARTRTTSIVELVAVRAGVASAARRERLAEVQIRRRDRIEQESGRATAALEVRVALEARHRTVSADERKSAALVLDEIEASRPKCLLIVTGAASLVRRGSGIHRETSVMRIAVAVLTARLVETKHNSCGAACLFR